jgi:hypothetical protein
METRSPANCHHPSISLHSSVTLACALTLREATEATIKPKETTDVLPCGVQHRVHTSPAASTCKVQVHEGNCSPQKRQHKLTSEVCLCCSGHWAMISQCRRAAGRHTSSGGLWAAAEAEADVQLSVCLTKHRAMKTCGGVEV